MSAEGDAGTGVRRPWLPGCLTERDLTVDDVESLFYVVVDEMVGDHVGLTVNPWPWADAEGRLRFQDRDSSFELALSRERLARELYKVLRLKRAPRVGDVFAARLSARGRELVERGEDVHWRDPLAELVEGVVYDISQEARKVAKLALYAMAAPVLSQAEARNWNVEERADRETRSAPARPLGGVRP